MLLPARVDGVVGGEPQTAGENADAAATEVDSLGYGYDECDTQIICEGTNDMLRLSYVQALLRNFFAYTYMRILSGSIL
jgi:hypothetical protein